MKTKRWQLILISLLLLVSMVAFMQPNVVQSPALVQAQSKTPVLVTLSFSYPTIKVSTISGYLRVVTGSVTYYFSDTGADQIYNSDGSYIGTKKWRLFADTLSLDLVGKVSYVMDGNYRVLVTRTIPLSKLNGSVVITYDITGERTKTSVTVNTGALLLTSVKSLKLGWINNISKTSIAEESIADGSVRYDLANGKYFSVDWHDVQDSLGDVGTLSISSLSNTKEAEIVFDLGALAKSSSITLDPTDEYTSAGEVQWECPVGVSFVHAEVRGAGGGGASYSSGLPSWVCGAGGGAGAYSFKEIGVIPGGNYTVIVGAAGIGGTPTATAGGNSSFDSATTVMAKGGDGAINASGGAGGAAASGYGTTKYSGGNGGNGAASFNTGGGGGGAGDAENGGNGGTSQSGGAGGIGGTEGGGDGGKGAQLTPSAIVAEVGKAPGGGGGGGGGGVPGRNGAVGKVVLTYYYVPVTETDGIADVTYNSCTLKGNISDDSGNTATYYKFEWDLDSGAPYANSYTSALGSYPEGAYSKAISSLSAGTEYFFIFSAYNVAGWGNSSEGKFLTLPVKPSFLADGAKTATMVVYTWSKGAGAQKTMVRYSDSAYPTAIDEGTQAYYYTGATTTIENLNPSTYYYVSAWSYVTTDGLEQWSIDYATDAFWTRPEDVGELVCGEPTTNSIPLSWGSVGESATKYKVIKKEGDIPASVADGVSIYFGNNTSTTAIGLNPNTLYGFGVWSYYDSSTLYATTGATCFDTTAIDSPTITNSFGVSDLGKTYATLNGMVTYTGGDNPACYFFWGESDEGTNAEAWEHTEVMGVQASSFNKNLEDLEEGHTYFYRTYGFNVAGEDWADSTIEFTCGCLSPGNVTVTKIGDYQYHIEWEKNMPISVIKMGISSPPTNPQDGTFIYKGNSTELYYYADLNCVDGNATFRVWSDCTSCIACGQYTFSEDYSEDSVILSGNCTGGGGGGDMYMAVYDTNSDGIVDAADYATAAGDADTLDGLHAGEISGTGYGNITFVTDSGNATTLEGIINILGMGTISTFGGNNTIQISGTTFLSLPDTPESYDGQGGLVVKVNAEETGLEFGTVECEGNCTGNITDAWKYISVDGVVLEASGADTLTLTGLDIEYTGDTETNTIDLAIGGERVEEIGQNLGAMSDYIKIVFILGLPLLLGLISVKRHSLTCYLASILGFAVAIPLLDDTFGLAIVIPAGLLIVGLAGSMAYDAFWGDGFVIA